MLMAHHFETAKKTIFTILAVMLAAYVFVILLTYTPNDPSWSHISSDMGMVSNMGGAAGAWFSDVLYSFLGLSAWWIIVFLAFEAAVLWWPRQQTIGLFRLIAYSLLILASSGLAALMPAIFSSNLIDIGDQGGILGIEVAIKLATLITIYGAAVFLLIFAFTTATFGFDIHWRRLTGSIFKMSWLGNGVKEKSKTSESKTEADDHYLVSEDNDDDYYAAIEASERADAANVNRRTSKGADSPLFNHLGQGELELPEGTKASPNYRQSRQEKATNGHGAVEDANGADQDNRGKGNVLNDFLVNTGITESIIGMRQQEAQTQEYDNQADENALVSNHVAQRQEPSFAWNDPHAMDGLLDENAVPLSVAANQRHQLVGDTSLTETEIMPAAEPPRKRNRFSFKQPAAVRKTEEESSLRAKAEVIEEIDIAPEVIESEAAPTPKRRLNIQSAHGNQKTDDDRVTKSTATDTNPVASYQTVAGSTTPKPMVDNTPPADPTKAPTITFNTPDAESSNHIEDMVPDTEDDAPSMPAIHDDAAFASKSRAMQTSKYREQLSPIPPLSILDDPDPNKLPSYTDAELVQLSELLEIKLQDFNVKAEVVNAIPGPVVTRFEVELAAGIKASKVTGISRDLARSLSMASLRVVEVIPGKPYIGIEVPNKKREMVRLIELLETPKFKDPKAQISMAMGKDIGGKPIITDLARAPHMLVAGTTGSGKSVLVNSMLLSILLKYKPSELRLILIDPKQLELANYNDIPHLLTPVVTDMNEAASALSWCVAEMERRYQLMSLLKVRKLGEFNKKVIAAEKAGKPMIDPLWRPNDSVSISDAPKLKTLPMIVIVADEFADMIMQVGKQAEELITRLAQKSRAAGIHLMLATQRPSVDVITGLIKANIPVRAALRVNSKVDSRTILDAGGAEDMLGNGDMLFLGPGQIEPERVHGAYVSDEEVNRVCDAWRERGAPDYIDNMASNFELSSPSSSDNSSGEDDQLYDEAVAFVLETRKVSASSIQRKFSIGYNRAARIVDSMEAAGLVSSMGKSGKRELLM